MDRSDVFGALLYLGAGALFFAAGIPLALGKIEPNQWYGLRTAKTLSNVSIWYTANETAGKDMMLAGAALIAAMLIFIVLKMSLFTALPVRLSGLVTLCLICACVVVHNIVSLARL